MNNVSNDNRRHGILVNSDNANNTVHRNQANDNDSDGITVAGGGNPATDNTLTQNRAMGNGRWDGSDFNFEPPCDNNTWRDNAFGTVNQECVDSDAEVVDPPAAAGLSTAVAEDDLGGMVRGSAGDHA